MTEKMKERSLVIGKALGILVFILVAKESFPQTTSEVSRVIGVLRLLSPMVDDYVAHNPKAQNMETKQIILESVKSSPALANALKDYKVNIRVDGLDSAILVCMPSGDKALVEDAGCSAEVDRQYTDHPMPCTFELNLKETCEAP